MLPYVLLGVALWACVHAGGLHATLAGVMLALFIPTRPPPNLKALMTQADTILAAEARHGDEVLRHGPSEPALRALDAIHDRLESPADRLLRHVGARSSYLVLPLFALANAGVALTSDVLRGHEPLMLAIMAGLVIGKPLGLVLGVGARGVARPRRQAGRLFVAAAGRAPAHWPASASPCRCSSPARRFRRRPTSPPPRSRCSPPRCCRR